MPSAPTTVTGNFTATTVQITITTSPANLLVSADGGTPVAAPLVENWTAGSSHTITTTSPQAGGAGVQYVWSSWSDSRAISHWSDSRAISHIITVPLSPTTYTATFSKQYQLTMVASPSADGSVTPASRSYYAGGAIIRVTATANSGFQFTNWTSTGGSFVSTTSPSTNFTMPSAPAAVTGNFGTFTISATPSSQTISSGHKASYTITLKSLGGLTGNVALSCNGAPLRSTCAVTPSSVMLNGTATVTVTLSASQSVNHGKFTLTFTGKLGTLTHSTSVSLTVK
jgi:hypothetical protein